MLGLNHLIQACHGDLTKLTLYDSSVGVCIIALLEHPLEELKIVAAQTVCVCVCVCVMCVCDV